MLFRPLVLLGLLLALQPIGFAQQDGDSQTAPLFLIDAEITDSQYGPVFIAARLYFEEVQQSYHVDSQRERPELANRDQELSILQSKLLRFSVNALEFRTVDGAALTSDEVEMRLAGKPAVLLLPKDASIHPAITSILNSDALVISKVRGACPQKLITRPEAR